MSTSARVSSLAVVLACFWSGIAGAEGSAETCARFAEQGQDLRTSGRLLEARRAFLSCARDECPAFVRKDCARWQGEVEDSEPTVVPSARDATGRDLADVRVFEDGALLVGRLDGTAVPVDPGVHTFRFERALEPPVERRVLVHEGEKNRLVQAVWLDEGAAPPDRAPARRSRDLTWVYVLGGFGVAALATSAAFEIRGANDWASLRSGCGATRACTDSQVHSVQTELWVGNITFFAGLAALAGAAWLTFAAPRNE